MGTGLSGDAQGDNLLLWATNPKFKGDRIRFMKMRTMRKKAVKLNIPDGVQQRDFTERADGSQRIVFFFRSLYDAVKQLLRSSRFAGSGFLFFASSGVEGESMDRNKSDRGIFPEGSLRSVSMVNIPIDDQHAIETKRACR